MNINGQERAFPQSDVAIIAFVPGDPAGAELNPLARRGAREQRNMIVMREGSSSTGRCPR